MWTIEHEPAATAYFGSLSTETILYEFDGPRIFTSRSVFGDLLLVYLCDEDDSSSRFLVVPCRELDVAALQTGHSPVRDVLARAAYLWIADRSHGGEVLRAWLVPCESLPEDALPMPGVLLLPSHHAPKQALRHSLARRRHHLLALQPPEQSQLFGDAA